MFCTRPCILTRRKTVISKEIEKLQKELDNIDMNIQMSVDDYDSYDDFLGKMEINSYGHVSFNGYKSDILKSGIQKYTRRGNFNKGLYCLIELDLFKRMGNRCKGIRTNMINRLMIILFEDVGIEIGIDNLLKIHQYLTLWKESIGENHHEDFYDDRFYLINIYRLFFKKRGNRVNDWIRHVYKHGANDDDILERYDEFYDGLYDVKKGYGRRFYVKNDSDEIKNAIDGFCYFMDLKEDKMFYYMFKIIDSIYESG